MLGLGIGTIFFASRGGEAPAPEAEPRSFTLTATELSVVVGYNPAFEVGSISREPLDVGANYVLETLYSRTDIVQTYVQFDGQHAALLGGYDMFVDGTPVVFDTDWTEADPGETGDWKTAAQVNSTLFATPGTYEITWQPKG